jgi:DeoR/GlpR family transcriptional regulator of sugar metabolism
MYAEERKKRIKRVLAESKSINVNTLSQLLNVSKVTIRRDLKELDEEGVLIKTHGGAILPEEELYYSNDLTSYENSEDYDHGLEVMGKIAKLIIDDGASVFLCPGKACEAIATSIREKNKMRIVTTDINIMIALSSGDQRCKMNVTIPGGELDLSSLSISGAITEQMLDNMFFDYAFIEVDGVTLERGYFTDTASKYSTIKKVIDHSNQTIIVCDHSKFDKQSMYNLGEIKNFAKIISTEKIPEKFKEYYFNNNIQLFTTLDVY